MTRIRKMGTVKMATAVYCVVLKTSAFSMDQLVFAHRSQAWLDGHLSERPWMGLVPDSEVDKKGNTSWVYSEAKK